MKQASMRTIAICLTIFTAAPLFAQETLQVTAPALGQVSFVVAGQEVAGIHFGADTPKPYVFPVMGPSGVPLTQVGHPYDPKGHCHHRSVWVGHHDVGGVNFWEDSGAVIVAESAPEVFSTGARLHFAWRDAAGKNLLRETRTITLVPLAGGERYVDINIELTPASEAVTFGATPYGLLGVRVPHAMGVQEGGGRVLNSEGGVDEAGTLWKQARWVDYRGTKEGLRDGITLFDHPRNPRFPTYFHVRNDGWMGASFTYAAPYTLGPGEVLALRYRLYAHGPDTTAEQLKKAWKAFGEE